jgi:hypothetical protein
MSHDANCPDPCRHDNECPHGRSNVAGEICPFCEGPLSDMTADWKVIRRATDALAEAVDNAVTDRIDWLDLPEDEAFIEILTDQVYDLVTKGEITPNNIEVV